MSRKGLLFFKAWFALHLRVPVALPVYCKSLIAGMKEPIDLQIRLFCFHSLASKLGMRPLILKKPIKRHQMAASSPSYLQSHGLPGLLDNQFLS